MAAKSRQRGALLCAGQYRGHSVEDGRYRLKIEKRPVEITVAGELPGFEYGGCRGVFLNLRLDVEIDRVTYHLSSSFAENTEMDKVINRFELEWNGRRTAYSNHQKS